jgi:MFS family permease
MTALTPPGLPPEGRSALRAGVVGNWIDNIHVFLPLTALAPAMGVLAGPTASASTGALIVVAMLFGRPLGGIIFGRIADRIGRARTTRLAIAGTALCALAIAATPTHEVFGAGTIALILAFRFIGGVFVAGEYSAAVPLTMEWSPPKRRGLMSGFVLSMAPWAQASIAFTVAVLLAILGPDRYAEWGWRSLFVAGAAASVGMLIYYTRHVTDVPSFHRRRPAPAAQGRVLGRWASAFWQVFILMSGLWLLTDSTALLLTERLGTDTPLSAPDVSVVIGIASIAQALVMTLAGHLSTIVGRRALFVGWGGAAAVVGPFLWWAAVTSGNFAFTLVLSSALQIITVSAYGPIAAYLSERFPAEVRSTGYGMGYSFSLVLPALYPFYLPWIEQAVGRQGSVMLLIALGGALVVFGAVRGPRFSPTDVDREIDEVAWAVTAHPELEDANVRR